jgi:hypothetical protein
MSQSLFLLSANFAISRVVYYILLVDCREFQNFIEFWIRFLQKNILDLWINFHPKISHEISSYNAGHLNLMASKSHKRLTYQDICIYVGKTIALYLKYFAVFLRG